MNKTLEQHAEEWWEELGNQVPPKDSPEWTIMYEEWIDYAFDDLMRKETRQIRKGIHLDN